MAVPNKKIKMALPRATQRGQIPRISMMPRLVPAAWAANARKGMVNAGMKEFTCATLRAKLAKFPQLANLPQRPKRSAKGERKAEPSAIRTYRIPSRSQDVVRATFGSFVCKASEAVESVWLIIARIQEIWVQVHQTTKRLRI